MRKFGWPPTRLRRHCTGRAARIADLSHTLMIAGSPARVSARMGTDLVRCTKTTSDALGLRVCPKSGGKGMLLISDEKKPTDWLAFWLGNLVGVRGFEPPAPASRRQCSTRLSYTPTKPSIVATTSVRDKVFAAFGE